ncbi:hypothetical protein KGV55_01985 [Candidatus Gracilibacteria bacterium]|nr:hypothetical protein [Candidatus Gracilibacteria bacterium]
MKSPKETPQSIGKYSPINAERQIKQEFLQAQFNAAFLFISGSSSDKSLSFDSFFTSLRGAVNMLEINPEKHQKEIETLRIFIEKYQQPIKNKPIEKQKILLTEMVQFLYKHFEYSPKSLLLSTSISTTVANALI